MIVIKFQIPRQICSKLSRAIAAAALAAALGFGFAAPGQAASPSEPAAEPVGGLLAIGRYSREPLPRFAVLKTDPVHLRRGPGETYPILWKLTRRFLPVRIIGEYGVWRRVELHNGDRGWIHRALLSSRRYATVAGPVGELYERPAADARLAARVAETTPLRIQSCTLDWCLVGDGGVEGWTPKRRLWGVAPDETLP